jgi:hypothetical protein
MLTAIPPFAASSWLSSPEKPLKALSISSRIK